MRKIIWGLAVIVTIVVLGLLGLVFFFDPCENSMLSAIPIDRNVEIRIYDRGCGATVSFVTFVTILKKRKYLPDAEEKILLMKGQMVVAAKLTGSGKILVNCKVSSNEVFLRKEKALGYEIEFKLE